MAKSEDYKAENYGLNDVSFTEDGQLSIGGVIQTAGGNRRCGTRVSIQTVLRLAEVIQRAGGANASPEALRHAIEWHAGKSDPFPCYCCGKFGIK